MKTLCTSALGLVAGCGMVAAAATANVAVKAHAIWVFSGKSSEIPGVLHNSGAETFDGPARILVYQTTSSTAAAAQAVTGNRVHILSGQTVLESTPLKFPPVRAVTPFLVEWTDGTNRVFGKSKVWVCPTNLLGALAEIANPPVAVFDPGNALKPALATQGVPFTDLSEEIPDAIPAQLAIVIEQDPFPAQAKALHITQTLSKRAVAIVWIRPVIDSRDKLMPSFYLVTRQAGAVVVAKSELVANLPENPRAQLNLLALARMAVQPEPFELPEPETLSTGPNL